MPTNREPDLPRNDAERLLASLAGVVSAHVVTDSTGRFAEIHILSSPDLHPKQVVRNVESALSAGLGIEVDRRIVSVAQIRTPLTNGTVHPESGPKVAIAADPAPQHAGALDTEPGNAVKADEPVDRLEFVRFRSRRDAEQCVCEVVLRARDEEVVGTGRGPDTTGGRAEAAARAVFDALDRARRDVRLELEGAVISSASGREYVIVSAHALSHRTMIPLAGAAALVRSAEEAAILAALQASNRWSS